MRWRQRASADPAGLARRHQRCSPRSFQTSWRRIFSAFDLETVDETHPRKRAAVGPVTEKRATAKNHRVAALPGFVKALVVLLHVAVTRGGPGAQFCQFAHAPVARKHHLEPRRHALRGSGQVALPHGLQKITHHLWVPSGKAGAPACRTWPSALVSAGLMDIDRGAGIAGGNHGSHGMGQAPCDTRLDVCRITRKQGDRDNRHGVVLWS